MNNEVGAAAATGDGDVMMRYLPSYRAVMVLLLFYFSNFDHLIQYSIFL